MTKKKKKVRRKSSKWEPKNVELLPRRINDDRADKLLLEASEILYELMTQLNKESLEDYEKAS